MAYRDPLTGLGNRKAFDEQLGQALLRAGSGGSELALLYLDLDRFKEVNDRFGHDIGDALLRTVAERVRSTLRQPDKASPPGRRRIRRAPRGQPENNPQRLAERLLAALVQPIALNGERIDFVTPSIGIALYLRHAGDAEGLVRAADSAMYEAKRQRQPLLPVPGASLKCAVKQALSRAFASLLRFQPASHRRTIPYASPERPAIPRRRPEADHASRPAPVRADP